MGGLDAHSLMGWVFAAEPLEPGIPPSPESRQVAVGEDLRLECEVAEAGEVTWMKGTECVQPSGHIQLLSHGRRQMLVIQGVTAEDQGEYRCIPSQGPAPTAFKGAYSGAHQCGWYSPFLPTLTVKSMWGPMS